MESLCILPYTSVNVRVVNGQRLKFNAVNGQSLKIGVVNGQTPKRAGQSFDLAVAAVTIESMGVTPLKQELGGRHGVHDPQYQIKLGVALVFQGQHWHLLEQTFMFVIAIVG